MDGTLLNSKRVVSDINKNAVKKAHDLGVQIVITKYLFLKSMMNSKNGKLNISYVSKGQAVKELAKYSALEAEEIITIGDSQFRYFLALKLNIDAKKLFFYT